MVKPRGVYGASGAVFGGRLGCGIVHVGHIGDG
jgi:hypothetical protein